ncbi:MAG: hypothetical protein O3B84_04365 [Chloroflexi bacterium]|nr:hypothetical protein [Chloroflexota bacterium]
MADLAHGQWKTWQNDNWPEIPNSDRLQIWAYPGRPSYEPGELAEFHVSTTADSFTLTIFRDGGELEHVAVIGPVNGQWHETPDDAPSRGCGWPIAVSLPVPLDWPPGGYLVVARAEDKRGAVSQDAFFVVRATASARTSIALLTSTYTWNAYNDWGGANAYSAVASAADGEFSPRLSLMRPWARGLVRAPHGSPRFGSRVALPIGAAIRQEWSEWAFANGYTRFAACAGWAKYDGLMARWLERDGWQFDLITQWDLDRDPDILNGRELVITCGHDEYWTHAGRRRLGSFIESGGHHARFGGNILWQVRSDWERQFTECYKFRMYEEPQADGPVEDRSGAFEAIGIEHPPVTDFGANGCRGIYAGWGGLVPRGIRGFVVYRPQHWAFSGTDSYYGDVIGSETSLVSYEADGVDYTFRHGLPYPTGSDGSPEELEILALTPVTLEEEDHCNAGSMFEPRDNDLGGIARLLFGEDSPESRERCRYGSAVITSLPRGLGEVFCAGSTEWPNSLALGDRVCEIVTRNVLSRFTERRD